MLLQKAKERGLFIFYCTQQVDNRHKVIVTKPSNQ